MSPGLRERLRGPTITRDGIEGIPGNLSESQIDDCAKKSNLLRADLSRLADEVFDGRLDLRCATCAFRRDTEANRTTTTILAAHRCLEARRLFYCHEGETSDALPITPCRGYLAARRERFQEDLAYEVAESWD